MKISLINYKKSPPKSAPNTSTRMLTNLLKQILYKVRKQITWLGSSSPLSSRSNSPISFRPRHHRLLFFYPTHSSKSTPETSSWYIRRQRIFLLFWLTLFMCCLLLIITTSLCLFLLLSDSTPYTELTKNENPEKVAESSFSSGDKPRTILIMQLACLLYFHTSTHNNATLQLPTVDSWIRTNNISVAELKEFLNNNTRYPSSSRSTNDERGNIVDEQVDAQHMSKLLSQFFNINDARIYDDGRKTAAAAVGKQRPLNSFTLPERNDLQRHRNVWSILPILQALIPTRFVRRWPFGRARYAQQSRVQEEDQNTRRNSSVSSNNDYLTNCPVLLQNFRTNKSSTTNSKHLLNVDEESAQNCSLDFVDRNRLQHFSIRGFPFYRTRHNPYKSDPYSFNQDLLLLDSDLQQQPNSENSRNAELRVKRRADSAGKTYSFEVDFSTSSVLVRAIPIHCQTFVVTSGSDESLTSQLQTFGHHQENISSAAEFNYSLGIGANILMVNLVNMPLDVDENDGRRHQPKIIKSFRIFITRRPRVFIADSSTASRVVHYPATNTEAADSSTFPRKNHQHLFTCRLRQKCSLKFNPQLSNQTCDLEPPSTIFFSNSTYWPEFLQSYYGNDCADSKRTSTEDIDTDEAAWYVPCSLPCEHINELLARRKAETDEYSRCDWSKAVWWQQPTRRRLVMNKTLLQPSCNKRYGSFVNSVDLDQCLRNTTLVFVGDSTNRGMMHYVLELLRNATGAFLNDNDKTHDMRVYANESSDNSTNFVFDYYPKFWLANTNETKLSFQETVSSAMKRAASLDRRNRIVLVIGGLLWLEPSHIEQLRLPADQVQRVFVKTLGAGFHHRTTRGMYVDEARFRQHFYWRNRKIIETTHARARHGPVNFTAIDTFAMTMSRYEEFFPGRCSCHFHNVALKSSAPSIDEFRHGSGSSPFVLPVAHESSSLPRSYHVIGDINQLYSQVLLGHLCTKNLKLS